MLRFIFAAILVFTIASVSYAIDAPALPASAKKLNGVEIVKLYDRHTITFEVFGMPLLLTGTDTYNFEAHSHSGNFKIGEKSGEFSGAIRVKGDQYCHTEGAKNEICVWVYSDGDDTYEVNSQGIVESKHRKQ